MKIVIGDTNSSEKKTLSSITMIANSTPCPKGKPRIVRDVKAEPQPLAHPIGKPRIVRDVKVEPEVKVGMSWIAWTEKSKDISFESSTKGEGDGEQKVARELGAKTLGQNSTYDMIPTLNGVKIKCDVKKLDAQNDFNTGKEGRDVLRPIKTYLTILLDYMSVFAKSEVFTADERTELSRFHDVSPDELAVGTLKRLKEVCAMLSLKKKTLRSTLPIVQFEVFSQKKEMSVDLVYSICQKSDVIFPAEVHSFMETILILQKMDHIYIDNPDRLVEDLDSLVEKIFTDTKVIIVDKNKGYMILENTSMIQFYRITRGHPRFKIIF